MLVDATSGAAAVAGAIRAAARATGASFEYLLATARAESNFNPDASARTSSARGLFQFIEQTWLATLKRSGESLGYGQYANAIERTASGRYEIADRKARDEILSLRKDAAANAAMAGALARTNGAQLAQRLGRPASDGELYIAHFLGAAGASRLISLASARPNTPAASLFPSAAAANRAIFYDQKGSARAAADVYANLLGRYDVARTGTANTVAAAPFPSVHVPAGPPIALHPSQLPVAGLTLAKVETAALPPARAGAPRQAEAAPNAPTTSVFHDMYKADQERGPISPIVRDLWSTRPRVAAALTGQAAPQPAPPVPPAIPAVAPTAPATSAPDRQLNLFRDPPARAFDRLNARS